MATNLPPEEKIALIKSLLQEVLHEDILEQVILKEKRPLVIYWGTATTGKPHCGYFPPMVKLAHFLRAGCRIKILLADVHGFLDNLKAPIELVEYRAKYYKHVLTSLLRAVGVPLDKLEFVLGSDYQYSRDYRHDLDKLLTQTTVHDSTRAGAEVVKQTNTSPLLSSLIYPLMQALDEEYLKVDAQFGGVDQRKIFVLAQDVLPKISYKERAHLMNPMVPGLAGGKMSASDPDSKIDLLDTPDAVKKKVRKALCVPREVDGNGVISFVEYVLLPLAGLKGREEFRVERREDEGPALVYADIATLKADYAADVLTPQLLKSAVTTALNDVLAPIQADYQADATWQDITLKAYPPPIAEKKIKKEKKKGTKHPELVANADGSVKGEGREEAELGNGTADGMMEKLAV